MQAALDVTCLALKATFEFSILLSCVSSFRIAISSSASVGSLPHSWSYTANKVSFTETQVLGESLIYSWQCGG